MKKLFIILPIALAGCSTSNHLGCADFGWKKSQSVIEAQSKYFYCDETPVLISGNSRTKGWQFNAMSDGECKTFRFFVSPKLSTEYWCEVLVHDADPDKESSWQLIDAHELPFALPESILNYLNTYK